MSTQRFGFDPANTDFDWRTVDEVLAAFETHDHSGGATPVALADPSAAPTATVADTGGTLANGQTLYYQVSFIDQFGLETAASAELAVPLAATASSTDPPNPTGDTGGTLPADTYYYALTVQTPAGESALGPPAIITVAPDQNLVHVGLPALPAGATAFNVWRQHISDAGWTKVATGVTGANWNDNGVANGTCLTDPATQPPDGLVGIGTNAVTVTVPDAGIVGVLPSAVKRWRLYRSTASGNYGTTALVAEVAVPGLDQPLPTTYVDTGTPLLDGAPLATSTTLRPSVQIADDDTGGGGGGGGSATAVNSFCSSGGAAALTIPATGTAVVVRFAAAGINQVGHDVNLIGPVDTDQADELGIFTDGIYCPFAALTGAGFAAGDQVDVELVYEHSPSSSVSAPTKLTAVVRADGTLDTGLVWPSVFMGKWTRLSLKVTPYYAGAPTDLAVQWGVAFVTGAPASTDALPAVADLATDSSTNDGNTGISWTDVPGGVINDGYHIFVYGPDNSIAFSNNMSDTSSSDVATGLSDGVNYTLLVVGSAYVGGVLVYGVAATDSFTGAVAPNPVTDVVVTSDAASITVTSWVAPVGGTAVASYNVTLLDAAGSTVVQGPTSVDAAGPLTASFTGLTASTAYTVRITAVSAASTESSPVDTSESTTA